jgi:hypothetical protein
MVKPPPGPAARKTRVWLRKMLISDSTVLDTLFVIDRFAVAPSYNPKWWFLLVYDSQHAKRHAILLIHKWLSRRPLRAGLTDRNRNRLFWIRFRSLRTAAR